MQNLMLRAKGLHTFVNNLSEVPEGALLRADNCVIDRDGVIESRRGFGVYSTNLATTDDRAKQLLTYKNRILVHDGDNLYYDNGQGVLTAFDGIYRPTEADLRIKYQEASGNLFFTTSAGIKKISARTAAGFSASDGYILDAGGVKALDLSVQPNYTNPGSGFLPATQQTAYIVVWGYRDANNNLILGTPSSRTVLVNTSATLTCKVDLRITIPNEVTEDYFFQVYRTGLFAGTPDEEYNLVYEENPTTAEIQAGEIITTDFSPDGLRKAGAFLYTNPISGQGILQANEPPPLAKDITLYRNSTFYANTQTKHELNVGLLSVEKIVNSATTGRSLTITDGEVTNTYTFDGRRNIFRLVTDTFANSTDGGYILFGSATRQYMLYLDKTEGATPEPNDPLTQNRLAVPVEITTGETAQEIADAITVEFTINPVLNADFVASSDKAVTIVETDTKANTADRSYFILYYLFNSIKHIVWFDKTGTSEPPDGDDTLGGTFVRVNISGDTTADEIATNLATVLDDLYFANGFDAAAVGNEVTVTSVRADATLNSVFGIVAPGSGWTIATGTPVAIPEVSIAAKNNGIKLGTQQLGNVPPGPPGTDWFLNNIQTGTGGAIGINSKSVLLSALPTLSQAIDETARSLVGAINRSKDRPQVTRIETDTKAATNASSFIKYSSALNRRNYAIWFNTTGSDPAPTSYEIANRILVEVDISADTTANEVALTLKNVLEVALETDATVSVATNEVTITNKEDGACDYAASSDVAPPGGSWVVVLPSGGVGAKEIVRATYLSGADDLPGQILIERRDFLNKPFYLLTSNEEIGESFNPPLPSTVESSSITFGANTDVTLVSDLALDNTNKVFVVHNFQLEDFPFSASYDNATQLASNQIRIPLNAVGYDSTTKPDAAIRLGVGTVISDNKVSPNRVFFSKTGQPEAVPTTNFIDIGPRDEPIERIISLRDSLFILKTDGVYRLSGDNPNNFSVTLFDDSAVLLAPDTAVTLNNQIYMLSTQGVATVSDTGVSIISRPIENSISRITAADYSFKLSSFAVSSESDRAFILFVPTDPTDITATQAFRFNSFTRTWTRWPISKLCGVVNPADDKIYLGPSDINKIEQERKRFIRQDYADRSFAISIGANAFTGNLLKPSSINNIQVGDMMQQTQFLTISQYNRLLRKLDLDGGLPTDDFVADLELFPGAELPAAMTALVTKLNSVDTAVYTFDGSSVPALIQTQYNAIITKLNSSDSDAFFKNYKPSTGTKNFEGLVVGKSLALNSIELRFQAPFTTGAIDVFRGVTTDFIYAPTHMGDPSMLKQVSESTLLFEFNNFEGGTLLFRTDLDRDFSGTDFRGVGEGSFGNSVFGDEGPFGGEGTQAPLRTYVPRNKQKCRFIEGRFVHKNAFNKFAIYGLSYTYRVLSTRGYR